MVRREVNDLTSQLLYKANRNLQVSLKKKKRIPLPFRSFIPQLLINLVTDKDHL